MIDRPPGLTGLNPGSPGSGIDPYALHARKINHEAIVAHRRAGNRMSASTNGQIQLPLTRKSHARHDIGYIRAASNRRRVALDPAVPQAPRGVITRVAPREH